jgi:hypothetical protein
VRRDGLRIDETEAFNKRLDLAAALPFGKRLPNRMTGVRVLSEDMAMIEHLPANMVPTQDKNYTL